MAERLAIKRLAAADCTLFEAVFRKIDKGNQKSITLNADVLTDQLYPNLAAAAGSTDDEITVTISLYGPGAKGVHKLTRKIIKGKTYKNWRLNGEFIYGPPDDPSRYDDVQADDLAVMVFKGELSPSGMDIIIVSKANPVDAHIYVALAELLPVGSRKSMVAVTSAQIAAAASSAAVPATHPIYIAAADPEMEAALEDAARGGYEGSRKLLSNRGNRKISSLDFAKAKAKAEITGQEGEGLVNGYLAARVIAGEIRSYTWASAENAIASFDFEILQLSGERVFVDVKTTGGPFDNPVHLSLAEVIQASGPETYLIYRVSEIDGNGGQLRISEDIGPLARHLKTVHETHMPAGIRVDGFSVATSNLTWIAGEYVERADDEQAT